MGKGRRFKNRRKQNNAGLDGYFEPDQRVTREMTAVVAVRLYERILNKELEFN